MTGLVLYDNLGSSNALKVRFLLAELGLEAQRREVAIGAGGDAYLAVHPFGLVPALVDGDVVITESNAALRHLARRAGADDLLGGASLARRARVDVLLDTLSLEVRGPLWAVEEVVVYGGDATPEDVAARTAALTAALTAYERLLADDGPYAAGPFTIADCALAGRLVHLEDLGLDPAVAPRLRERVVAARARPAFARALAGEPGSGAVRVPGVPPPAVPDPPAPPPAGAVPAAARQPTPVVVAPGAGHRVGNVEFLARTADTPRFTFAVVEIAADRVLEPHVHAAEDDAFYILEGEMTFVVGGAEHVAGPGTFVLVPPGTPHGFRADRGGPVRMLNLHAPGGFDRRIGLRDRPRG